jgi:large subunit ribosomal protein L15
MQLHTLKLTTKRKKRKTIGRGGKKGTYSGKGMKGQKARSGAHVKPLFEGGRSTLIDHMKKKRGFKSPHNKKAIVKLENIDKKFKNGDEITVEALISAGLVDKMEAKNGIKILGGKDSKKKFTFEKNISLSKSVAQK